MLLRIFRGTSPGVVFLIILTLFSVWISSFIRYDIDSLHLIKSDKMPLYALLQQIAGRSYWSLILSLLMVSFIAFLLVNFNTSLFFINERTFLPALIFILFLGLFPACQYMNPVIPASIFLMLSVKRIMDGYRKPGIAYNFFDAALLIGTGSLFYANLIWFWLLVLIGIALLRTGNVREIALSVIGLITPYLITIGIYYVLGKDLLSLLFLIEENLFGVADSCVFDRLTIVVLIYVGVLVMISILYLVMSLRTKKIKTRQTFSLLLWVFIISLTIYIILPSVSIELVYLAGLPVSYFMTHYFLFVKKRIVPELFFTFYFVLILLIQVLYIIDYAI
jgi:hypothetical protein